jgi:hypothetical protein
VQTLNTAIAVFPSSLVARAFGFGAREFFTTGGEAANAPAVDLAPSATQ